MKQERHERHERPLGDAREAVLVTLARTGGVWQDTPHAWRWEKSTHWTTQLLYSLGARGLVLESAPGVFELTPEGQRRANYLTGL